jgi:hypothetical protein
MAGGSDLAAVGFQPALDQVGVLAPQLERRRAFN